MAKVRWDSVLQRKEGTDVADGSMWPLCYLRIQITQASKECWRHGRVDALLLCLKASMHCCITQPRVQAAQLHLPSIGVELSNSDTAITLCDNWHCKLMITEPVCHTFVV